MMDARAHGGALESTYTFVPVCLPFVQYRIDKRRQDAIPGLLSVFRAESASHRGLEVDISRLRGDLEKN